MHGLMRVRGFSQDDGHIFCTEEQIESETGLVIELLSRIYKDLGCEKFDIKLSTRPEIRVGSDGVWDKAENALESAIKNKDGIIRYDLVTKVSSVWWKLPVVSEKSGQINLADKYNL